MLEDGNAGGDNASGDSTSGDNTSGDNASGGIITVDPPIAENSKVDPPPVPDKQKVDTNAALKKTFDPYTLQRFKDIKRRVEKRKQVIPIITDDIVESKPIIIIISSISS